MKIATSHDLPPELRDEVEALAAMQEDAIDFSDIPEVTDWTGAKRGMFYRPIKQPLTLRLDADVVAWFKARATDDEKYQTTINRVLREYVQQHSRSA